MLTMHPVALRGRTALELAPEEFEARRVALQAQLVRRGLDALLAFGDARSYAPLAWVTGLVPMLKSAVAVVPASGESEIYLAMPGAREPAAMRKLAVVGSVGAIGELAAALTRFGRVAVAGIEAMRAGTEATIRRATEVVDGGDVLLNELMAVPSERERELLRLAAATAQDAALAIAGAYADGATVSHALLCGDFAARDSGMHDVRVLWSPDGGRTLRPPEAHVKARPEPFVFYIAVETSGYWGEALRSLGGGALFPAGLAPIARLGLCVDERVEGALTAGFYSFRALDQAGALRSRTTEVA
jgi:hypothetical protein